MSKIRPARPPNILRMPSPISFTPSSAFSGLLKMFSQKVFMPLKMSMTPEKILLKALTTDVTTLITLTTVAPITVPKILTPTITTSANTEPMSFRTERISSKAALASLSPVISFARSVRESLMTLKTSEKVSLIAFQTSSRRPERAIRPTIAAVTAAIPAMIRPCGPSAAPREASRPVLAAPLAAPAAPAAPAPPLAPLASGAIKGMFEAAAL